MDRNAHLGAVEDDLNICDECLGVNGFHYRHCSEYKPAEIEEEN